MHRSIPFAFAGAFAALSATTACSDAADDGTTQGSSTGISTSQGSGGGPGGAAPGGSSSGGGGSGTAAPEVVAAFDATKGELPEGLALDVARGRAFVGFAPTGAIVSVDLDGGAVSPHGSLPTPPPNAGFMTGLTIAPDGALFAALVSFSPDAQPGIYRVPPEGGPANLFASDSAMVFPNGIVPLAGGALLVTDSAAGAVFRIDAAGGVASWASSEMLQGQLDYCGPDLNTFDIGANGIALGDGAVFVTNNDLGSVVRIPLLADGSAGTPELFAGPDCAELGGADGLVVDGDDLLVAVNRQDRIARVSASGAVTTVAEGEPLDFPASLALHGGASEPSLFVTSFALARASAGREAHPALVRLGLP